MATDTSIRLIGLRHQYGNTVAVHGLDLTIADGEFLTLLGPSGSGKTTTLMMLAGFLKPSAGEIRLGEVDIVRVAPQKRNFGMVFQNYALFPHLTVRENVRYPLRMRRVPRNEAYERADAALVLVGLAGLEHRRTSELSGGQQQRVALARAVVFEPRLLLMDEPLGALDKKLRQEMQTEIKRLQQRLGITIVYVTHDQEEALSMSDRIAVMNHGRLVQIGTPTELYSVPRTAFVADFLGDANLLSARCTERSEEFVMAASASGRGYVARIVEHAPQLGEPVTIGVRPEHIVFDPPEDDGERTWSRVPGMVRTSTYLGDAVKLVIDTDDGQLLVKDARHDRSTLPGPGEAVCVGWAAAHAHVVENDV